IKSRYAIDAQYDEAPPSAILGVLKVVCHNK
mgnify:CR=1